jgi:hypothetical protein
MAFISKSPSRDTFPLKQNQDLAFFGPVMDDTIPGGGLLAGLSAQWLAR